MHLFAYLESYMHICISRNTETTLHPCRIVLSNIAEKARGKRLNLWVRLSTVGGSKKDACNDSLCPAAETGQCV